MPKFIYKYIFLCAVLFSACDFSVKNLKTKSTFYTETIDFSTKNNCWLDEQIISFNIPPMDNDLSYDIFFIINYTADYPFHNIHLRYSFKSDLPETVETGNKDLNLFDEITGKPLGPKFLSKMHSMEFLIIKNYQSQTSTKHIFAIQQYMRIKSLRGVRSVTLKIISHKRLLN